MGHGPNAVAEVNSQRSFVLEQGKRLFPMVSTSERLRAFTINCTWARAGAKGINELPFTGRQEAPTGIRVRSKFTVRPGGRLGQQCLS